MKKLEINSNVLKGMLSEIAPAIKKKPVLTVLENCLMEYKNDELTLVGTSLDITKIVKTKDCQCNKDFKALIFYQDLNLLINKIDSQELIITFEEKKINIITFRGDYNVPSDLSLFDTFPELPDVKSENIITIKGEVLNSLIKNISSFCGNDELRPVMTGILLNVENDNLYAVATNANILKKIHIPIPIVSDFSVICSNLKGMFKSFSKDSEITISYNDKFVKFETDKSITYLRTVEGQYPNYNSVIPDVSNALLELKFNNSEAINSIERLHAIIDVMILKVEVNIKELKINIIAENIDISKNAKETLDIEIIKDNTQEGQEILFGLSPSFSVELTFFEPNKAMLFNENNDISLIMPMLIT